MGNILINGSIKIGDDIIAFKDVGVKVPDDFEELDKDARYDLVWDTFWNEVYLNSLELPESLASKKLACNLYLK